MGIPKADLDNSRLGIVYLFGHTTAETNVFNVVLEGALSSTGSVLDYLGGEAAEGGLGLPAAATAGQVVSTVVVPASKLLDVQGPALKRADRGLLDRIQSWLTDYVKHLLAKLSEKHGVLEITVTMVEKLVKAVALYLAEKLVPFFSEVKDAAKGMKQLFDAAAARFDAWWQGHGVAIREGEPSVVVQAIQSAMNMSLCQGLYEALKGSGQLALAVLSSAAAGLAGTLVSIITAVIEMLTKLVWRLVEVSQMNKVFGEAADLWKQRGQPDPLHERAGDFAAWYRSRVLKLPALAVLTLNSGICFDKMRFLHMFSDDEIEARRPAAEAAFQKGAAYVDSLKAWGSDYLESCGYQFRSEDKSVAGYIELARRHGARPAESRAWGLLEKALHP